MNIAQILSERAREAGAQIAIRTRRHSISFNELEAATAQFAYKLRQLGMKPGNRAIILCPISLELYTTLIGCFRSGVVAVFPDPSAGSRNLDHCIRMASPDLFIGSAKAHLLSLTSKALRHIPRKMLARSWSTREAQEPLPIEPVAASDVAMITFTTGSTGLPKAAPRTHGFLLAQHAVLQRTLALTPGQVDLTALPIFVLANLASGVTSVIPDADLRRPGAINPYPVIRQIGQWEVTSAVAAPAFFERLLEARSEVSTLRKIFTGGAPVFTSLLDRLAERFPLAKINAVYGSTEAEPIAEIERSQIGASDIERMRRGDGLLAGHPVSEICCKVISNQWGEPVKPLSAAGFAALCVPTGEAGEIVVSGAHVLSGYLDGRGDEETKFYVEGTLWHRSGDLGRFDAAHRLWLLGRASARISDEAGLLYPFTVECAVSFLPGVRRSAVTSLNGRRVLALEADAIPANLLGAIKWAGMDEIRLCRIPVDRRHNSKIDYPALRRLLS